MKSSDEKDRIALDATEDQMRIFWSKTKQLDNGCIIWTWALVGGYGRAYISGHDLKAHRVVLVRAEKRILTGLMARHKCRNKACCNIAHLEVGTAQQNVHDRYRDGTMKASQYGEENHFAKFTREQVRGAYMMFASGHATYAEVASHFGMAFTHVEQIVKRKVWKRELLDLPDISFDIKTQNKARGSKQHLARLIESDIAPIRAALKQNNTIAECKRLARVYRVAWQTIYSVKTRQTWKHLA